MRVKKYTLYIYTILHSYEVNRIATLNIYIYIYTPTCAVQCEMGWPLPVKQQ